MRRSEDTNQENKIENYILRISFRSPMGQWGNLARQAIIKTYYSMSPFTIWAIFSHAKKKQKKY